MEEEIDIAQSIFATTFTNDLSKFLEQGVEYRDEQGVVNYSLIMDPNKKGRRKKQSYTGIRWYLPEVWQIDLVSFLPARKLCNETPS